MRYTYTEVITLINRLLEISAETTANIVQKFGLESLKSKSTLIGLNTVKHGSRVKDMNVLITNARIVAYNNSQNRIECLASDGITTIPAYINIGVGTPKIIHHVKADGVLKVEAEIQRVPWDNYLVMVIKKYSIIEKFSNDLLMPQTKSLYQIMIELIYMTEGIEEPYKTITQTLIKQYLSDLVNCPASKDIYYYKGGLIDSLFRTMQLIDYLQKVNNSNFVSNVISMINKCVVTSFTDLNAYHSGDTSVNLVSMPNSVYELIKSVVEIGRIPKLGLIKSAVVCANIGKIKDLENYQLHSCQMIQKSLSAIGMETITDEYINCISERSIEGKLLEIFMLLDKFIYRREVNIK